MVYVGIDVAKDKHDCFIVNSDGEVLYDVFTIQKTWMDLKICCSKSRLLQKI